MKTIDTIVFDLGGVLIDWNPRHLYSRFFDRKEDMEWFLTHVCHGDWNMEHDAGKPFAEGIAEKVAEFPQYEKAIRAYFDQWIEMICGPMTETVSLLEALKSQGYRLFALTNWSAETFPLVRHEYALFDHFDSIVVSGDEGLAKPDPRFFQLLMERHRVVPEASVFIDDNQHNVDAAKKLGFHTVWFKTAADLQLRLQELHVL